MKIANLNNRLEQQVKELVDRGYELGVQIAVYLNSKLILEISVGRIASDSNSKVNANTLFPVCSTGKGIMATLIHVLAADAKVDYDRPVAHYWPEYGINGKSSTTVRQVLSHQAGIPLLPEFNSMDEIWDWDVACSKVAMLTPIWIPGTNVEYHAYNWGWIVGKIAEGATGLPLRDIVREKLTSPLGIEDSLYFGTDDDAEKRVSMFESQPVKTEQCTTAAEVHATKDKSVPGSLMDFVNMPETRRACIPATNGMMTAGAIAKLYASMIGEVDGISLLPKSILDKATSLETQPYVLPKCFGHGFGLGYALKGPASAPGIFFGHGGAGGSEGMANRLLGLAIGITKNRMDTHNCAPEHTNQLIINEIMDTFGHNGDGGFYRND